MQSVQSSENNDLLTQAVKKASKNSVPEPKTADPKQGMRKSADSKGSVMNPKGKKPKGEPKRKMNAAAAAAALALVQQKNKATAKSELPYLSAASQQHQAFAIALAPCQRNIVTEP